MADGARIIVLEGDQTGQELLEQALRLLDPDVCGLELELEHYDLSLENRRRTDNEVVLAAARAMVEAGLRHQGGDDHARGCRRRRQPQHDPARADRRQGDRPHRPADPGSAAGRRRALPDLGRADGRRRRLRRRGDARGSENGDEVAFRTERIERSTCRAVAEYAFRTAKRMHARVYGGPKWTVSPIYEGMLKEEIDAAAQRHPDVPYNPQLIDAAYAGLIGGAADSPLVIPALNRDGDSLSELVLRLFGSVAGAESVLLSFDDDLRTRVAMTEAPHGTAPALEGKNIANPMAMILAVAALLHHVAERSGSERGGAGVAGHLRVGARGGRRRACATPDLGGHATTTEFTDEVIARVRTKIEIWSSLGRERA